MRGLAIAASFILAAPVFVAPAFGAGHAVEGLENSAAVFSEVMSAPDKGIPQELLEKAQCAVIVPGLKKAAFVVGAEYGRGFAICRRENGEGWGAPSAVRMEGGSLGFQLGGSDTDMVLLVMSRRGMEKLTQDKFTLGADATAAAGPVGRNANASTDLQMHAEILAWSRTRGLFAGISVKGATLRPANDWNRELYGHDTSARAVLMGNAVTPPPAAQALVAGLDRYSSMSGADRVRK